MNKAKVKHFLDVNGYFRQAGVFEVINGVNGDIHWMNDFIVQELGDKKPPKSFLPLLEPDRREPAIERLHRSKESGVPFVVAKRVIKTHGIIRVMNWMSTPVFNKASQALDYFYMIGVVL